MSSTCTADVRESEPLSPVFRPAHVGDLGALLALIADDTLGKNRELDAANPSYLKAFEAISADPNQQLLVAELDGRTIGMAQLSFIPGLGRGGAWRCNVEAVRIASDVRGQGFGAQLMRACEARARERGCSLLQLTSDASRVDAHRFYRGLGYVDSHIGFKKQVSY